MHALALLLAAAPLSVTIGERVETSVAGRYRSAAVTDPAIAELDDLGEGRLRIYGSNEGVTAVVITAHAAGEAQLTARSPVGKKMGLTIAVRPAPAENR